MFVVKMSNGRGLVEWYRGLSVRAQGFDKDDGQKFSTVEAAERAVRNCQQFPDAFSGAYFDEEKGGWHIDASIEPA